MTEKNTGLKLLGVAVLVVIAALQIYPPNKKLKPGIDLAGGHSLIYEIDETGLSPEDRVNLARRVMVILQRRVDPRGVMNLEWRPIGNNRLEIRMPRAGEESRKAREAYTAARERLQQTVIQIGEIEIALEERDPQRHRQMVDDLVRGVNGRQELLTKLDDAYQAYHQALAGDSTEAKAKTEIAYDQALDAVLATNIDLAHLLTLFALPEGNTTRVAGVDRYKERFPSLAEAIDQLAAAYTEWTHKRGALGGPEDLKRLLKGAGVLEFRILPKWTAANEAVFEEYYRSLDERGPRPQPGQDYQWFIIDNPYDFLNLENLSQYDSRQFAQSTGYVTAKYGEDYYVLAFRGPKKGLLATGPEKWSLKRAGSGRDPATGRLEIRFELDARGGSLFYELTRNHIGQPLCILLDDRAINAANIQSAIHTSGRITGQFTQQQVQYIVQTLEAGSLPGRLKDTPIMERTIGANVGGANREAGIRSAVIGFLAVAAIMIVYYMRSGVIAVFALLLNLLFTVAVMSALGATWTLPGIAGLVLGLAMAVDANVLINERIREELELGSGLRTAVRAGYSKAFSTILDSNVTTLLTAIIIFWFGSEEIRGFGLTLSIGLAISMFTALTVTQLIITGLIKKNWIKKLPMLRLIGTPSIDWMGLRKYFVPISLTVAIGGLVIFFYRGDEIYDIEFRGGTSAQIQLREGVHYDLTQLENKVQEAGTRLFAVGETFRNQAKVEPVPGMPGTFDVSTSDLTAGQLETIIQATFEDSLVRGGIQHIGSNAVRITCKPVGTAEEPRELSAQQVEQRIPALANAIGVAGHAMENAKVTPVAELGEDVSQTRTYEIASTVTNKQLMVEAIVAELGNELDIEPALAFHFLEDPVRAPKGQFPITLDARRLEDITGQIDRPQHLDVIPRFRGGVAFVVEAVQPPQTPDQLVKRLREMRLQPDYEDSAWRDIEVLGLTPAKDSADLQGPCTELAVLVVDENLPYEPEDANALAAWQSNLAEPEARLVTAALGSAKSLQKVTQFAAPVARQAKQRAALSLILALIINVGYIWFRFGTLRFGLGAIIALIHDVAVAMGAVALTNYIYGTPIANLLGLHDFDINLTMVAAFLTIVGYSINDTIVIFDRIRENRGKLATLSRNTINDSINQTLSRTIMTSSTTLACLAVMYAIGGRTIHGFAFVMFIGIVTGTYSSIAIASPLLMQWRPRRREAARAAPVPAG
jgi:SecD/SecF fusion protein